MGLFSFGSKKQDAKSVNWVHLDAENKLNDLIKESNDKPVMFFKHSTRCSISSMALSRLESNWDLEDAVIPVYLDLIAHRDLSNKLVEVFTVDHQSPQIILVKDGISVLDISHSEISVDAVKKSL